MAISFTTADVSYRITASQRVKNWLKSVIEQEDRTLGAVTVVWCSDEYLLGVNRQFLDHDYYTDIITFDYTEGDKVSGDLMISLDRIKDNSKKFNTMFHVEQLRVLVHGILHLCGYKDKTKDEEKLMREKENFYLEKYEV